MIKHSFMFLDSDFQDISNFCMRMEKNIVESDGVDAVIWAGKIAERVTHYITKFIGLNLSELDQNKKLNTLYNKGIIPEEYFNQLDSIRQDRNIATHHILKNEMKIAKATHRKVFNILTWFYGTYKGDPSYLKLRYPGVTYRHDESFLRQLRENINAGSLDSSLNPAPSIGSPYQKNADYIVHNAFDKNNIYFNEELNAYTAFFDFNDKRITIGHFKTREVAERKGNKFFSNEDFKLFKFFNGCLTPEKLDNGRYSDSKGIDFDIKEELWKASFDNKDLGYFISENSAIIARKEYIDTLPLPVAKNGSYSDYKEISFDLNHKLWYIKKEGKILNYYDSEREAIHDLSNVFRLDIDLEDLGIVQDENDSRWKIFYKNKYVATCDTKNQAIKKRLSHISGFAQPKRNKDGEYSIHKGIYYDDKNLIWILTIKGETLGFFDTEEDAFNHKKEFLKSKGFDVSNLNFHEEESFDDSFDFKVKINSEENAVFYDDLADEWIVCFRGNEIGRKQSEEDAKKLRRSYLKEMPYPPKKSNGKYSFIDGIDYDIDSHLWLAKKKDGLIGYYDSEEDAFYGLKEALVKDGLDVRDMHFFNSDISKSRDEKSQEDNPIQEDSSKDTSLLNNQELSDSNIESLSSNSNLNEDIPQENKDINQANEDIGQVNGDIDQDDGNINDSIATSLKDMESFKKSPFYGIGNRDTEIDRFSDDLSIADLESDDYDEYMEDLDLDKLNLDKNNGFLNISENLFNRSNRKDLKEIKFNSYDEKNFRREIILSYNDSYLCISLEGMVNKDELKDILFLDLLDNMVKLNYTKEDEEYFSIFIKLHYNIGTINLEGLINVLSDLGWKFDLLSKLAFSSEIYLNSVLGEKLIKFDEKSISSSQGLAKSSSSVDLIDGSRLANLIDGSSSKKDLVKSSISKNNLFQGATDKENAIGKSKSKLDLKDSTTEEKSFNSKDYLDTNPLSKRKIYPKQESLSSKGKKSSYSKSRKAIIRGGVRVSLEEANELDNAKENKEIKSNIIEKKPELVKTFKTTSLDNILVAKKANEEEKTSFNIGSNQDMERDIDLNEDVFEANGVPEDSNHFSQSSPNDDFDGFNDKNSLDESNAIDNGMVFDEEGMFTDYIEDVFDESDDLEPIDVSDDLDSVCAEDLTPVDVSDGLAMDTDDLDSVDVSDGLAMDTDDLDFVDVSDDLTSADVSTEESYILEDNNLTIDDELVDSSNELNTNNLSSSEKFNEDFNDLTAKELFDDSSETSFEDELDNIGSSNKEILTSGLDSDLEGSVVDDLDSDLNKDDVESNSKESIQETEISPKKPKSKVKKDKKPKRIPSDAYDEKYANSTEIEYDEEREKWIAYIGGDLIRSFDTPKEAYIERKKQIKRRVRRPKRHMDGKYSEYDGVDFDLKEGLWSSSVNGIVINYSITEKEALMKRTVFVDIILDKFDTAEDEFDEELLNKIKATDFEELFADLSDEDLKDSTNLSLKEVKKELIKF